MQKVLTAKQMREVDRLTTERYGIPSILLMENAAHAVARVITEKLGGSVKGKTAIILCGPGSNGGDGAALARYLFTQWVDTEIYLFGTVEQTRGDARTNFEIARRLSLRQPPFYPSFALFENASLDEHLLSELPVADFIVDALFGTGISRPLDGTFRELFSLIGTHDVERKKKPLLFSIDIPSGINADSGDGFEPFFPANVTITLTAPKTANVIPPNSQRCGELFIGDIGTPYEMLLETESKLILPEVVDVKEWMYQSRFSDSSYKNKRGHALIVAGSEGYSGAAVMCGNSAMRSGVGLTTLMVPASCKVEVASRTIPEVIVRTIAETDGEVSLDAFAANQEAIGQADSILVGPGLKATDKGVERFVREIVERGTVPLIVDAGALWFFNPPASLLRRTKLESSPPYEGGVAPASGDGVVLSSHMKSTSAEPPRENHPVGSEQPPPLLCKEGSPEKENPPVGSEQPPPLLCKEGSFELPPLILTPHEGEFLRLLGTDDKDAIKDRVTAVRDFAVANDVILVLKGERVLIGSPDGRVVVNPTGNSGLGKAGNGDTLAGILAGFVAQAVKFEIDIFETVVAAVYVAGMAGDVAEKKFGKRVITASDVRECLVDVFAEFERI